MYEFDYEYLIKEGDNLLSKKGSLAFSNLPSSYEEFRKRLGLVIAYIREYMEIEQNVLTKKLGINFHELENGLRDITCKKLYTLGEAINIPIAVLIAFTCCGDGEWTEENMKVKVNMWREENKTERKKLRSEKNNKAIK